MKLVMDERLKHRLIGLAVIISLGAIFAPAVMRKSSQKMDSNFSVNVKLPPKPVAPDVAVTDEKDMFKTIKIAKVDIPAVSDEGKLSELVKAEAIKSDTKEIQESSVAQVDVHGTSEPLQVALSETLQPKVKKEVKETAKKIAQRSIPVVLAKVKPVVKPKVKVASRAVAKMAKKPVAGKEIYAVQLASFSQLTNAQILVSRLRSKGYQASYTKVPGRQGNVYKVYAGHSQRKNEVIKLKTQLASAMRLNGFVVNTGVS